MKIIYNQPSNTDLVITIGTFDGLHKGHQQIINQTIDSAEKLNCDSALLTFEPHPLQVVNPNRAPKLLTSWKQKVDIIKKLGVNRIIFKKFTLDFANLSYQQFIRKYLVNRFNVKKVIVGQDFRCGKQSLGSPIKMNQLGSKYGFEVDAIPSIKVDHQDISSTYIRELISTGKVNQVKKQLGRNFIMDCKVVSGDQRGRKLGYPTANLQPVANYVSPPAGVYGCRIKLANNTYDGIANLGYRPTFKKDEFAIEVYIFDFSADIYDQRLEIEFIKRIRSEMEFESSDQLVNQIEKDIVEVKKVLK